MALSRAVSIVASCSALAVQGGLVVKSFSKYPGYGGTLAAEGVAVVGQSLDTEVNLWYMFQGADPKCNGTIGSKPNSCGIHIHAGACSTPPAGHFYATATDPWATMTYEVSDGDVSASNVAVNSGKTQAINAGNSVVVHDFDGTRVACGNLDVDTQKDGTSAVYANDFSKYVGYTGALAVVGTTTIQQTTNSMNDDVPAVFLEYSLTGVDPTCLPSAKRELANSCGIHVHAGPCSAAAGHYFKAGGTDPWAPVVYFSDASGKTGASISVQIPVGETVASMVDRSFVVHDFTGARIACAPITLSSSEEKVDGTLSNGAPGLALGGALTVAVLAAVAGLAV